MTNMNDLVKTLRSGEQADMDGTLVKVSRQACEEAADAIEALKAKLHDMHRRAQTAEAALREPIEAAAPERRTLGRVMANAAFYAEHDRAEALQAQLAEAREQRDRAIALAEKAQDRLIEAMDRVDEARDKALEDAAQTAETRHGVWLGLGADCLVDDDISACSDIATAIRAMKGERE